MPAPRIIGYEPDPELRGGYVFHRDGAEPLYGWGPDAEALRQELDRTAPPDERTAGGTRSALSLTRADVPRETPGAAPMIVQQGPRGPVAIPAGRNGPPAPQPAAPAPPPPPLPGGAPAPPAAPSGPEVPPPPMVRVPYSPAVSREQLEQHAGSAVGIPQTISREVEGAIPYDQQGLQIRTELEAERRGLAEETAQRKALEEHQRSVQIAAELPRLEMEAAEQRHQYQQVRNRYEAERADLDNLIAEHREKRVNPAQLFQSQSTLGEITSVLSQALGAFSATLTGGENWAQRIIDQAVERDIRAQEENIRQSGGNVDNALAMLQRRYGDMEQAKASLRLAMQDIAAMQREEMAAEARSQDVLTANRQWDLEYQEQHEALERQIRDASFGKVSTRIAEKAQFPHGAQGGGTRPMTDEEETKYYERQARKAVAQAKVRGGGVDPDVAAKASGQRANTARTDVQEYGKSLAATEETVANYDRVLEEAGLRYNPDTKKVEGYTGDIPGVGLVERGVPSLLVGERGRKLRQALTNTLDAFGRARTGANMPPAEIDAFKRIILGAGTEQEFISGMEMLRSQIDSVRQVHEARFGKDTVEQYDRNRQDVEAGRSTKARAAGIERY